MNVLPTSEQDPKGALSTSRVQDPVLDVLIDTGAVLSSSLDPATTMRQVAELTVPRLASLCVIDLLKADGTISDVAVVCTDDEIAHELEELRARKPLSPDGSHPAAKVIRSGQPELLPKLSTDLLISFAEGSEHARFMVDHHYTSAVVAPLMARDRILGSISLLRLKGGPSYTEADLRLVQELARRAALAIDNARLFSELQSAEARMEAVLAHVAEAISVNDHTGKIVFANRAAAELTLVESAEELMRSSSERLVDPFLFEDEHGRELGREDFPNIRLMRGESAEPVLMRRVAKQTGEERWLVMRATPIRDPGDGHLIYVVNVVEDITDVKRAALAESFIAEASRTLASSMDYELTLRRVARLAVPGFADWCAVDLIGAHGELERVAVHHADPGKRALAGRYQHDHPPRRGDAIGVADVLRSGRGQLIASVDAETLSSHARDGAHLELLREMGAHSAIAVPMMVGTRAVGVITLLSCRPHRAFSGTDLAVAEELGRLAGISVENARLYTERTHIAHTLQLALLPETLPAIEGGEIEALYTAAGELNEVGGDFYDAFEVTPGRWMLAIGDVCGKGPRAAGVTALARHTLRAAAVSSQPPTQILQTLHRALLREPAGRDLCTVALVFVEPHGDGASLTIALAGHPAPLVIDRLGGVRRIGRNGTLLGVVEPVSVHEVHEELHPGETLLMYTDGASEAGNPDQPLGEDGLRAICSRAPELTLPALLEVIKQAALERTDGGLRDDMALVAFRVSGGTS